MARMATASECASASTFPALPLPAADADGKLVAIRLKTVSYLFAQRGLPDETTCILPRLALSQTAAEAVK